MYTISFIPTDVCVNFLGKIRATSACDLTINNNILYIGTEPQNRYISQLWKKTNPDMFNSSEGGRMSWISDQGRTLHKFCDVNHMKFPWYIPGQQPFRIPIQPPQTVNNHLGIRVLLITTMNLVDHLPRPPASAFTGQTTSSVGLGVGELSDYHFLLGFPA